MNPQTPKLMFGITVDYFVATTVTGGLLGSLLWGGLPFLGILGTTIAAVVTGIAAIRSLSAYYSFLSTLKAAANPHSEDHHLTKDLSVSHSVEQSPSNNVMPAPPSDFWRDRLSAESQNTLHSKSR